MRHRFGPFCVKELQWAKEAGIPIQPVIRMEDKTEIGTFLSQAPDDLKDIGNIDFIDLWHRTSCHAALIGVAIIATTT